MGTTNSHVGAPSLLTTDMAGTPHRESDRVFSLSDTVAQCAFDWSLRTREKGLALVSHSGEIPRGNLHGRPRMLRAALDILLHNAVRFTEQGSVSLDCRVGPLDGNRLDVTFRVGDTGVGFDESITHLLLSEPGLAQLRGLIAEMGGELTLTSTPGRGTLASFTVPMLHEPAEMVVIDVGPSPTRSGLAGMLSGRAHSVAAESIVAADAGRSSVNVSDGIPATPPGARKARLLLVDGARMSQTVVSALLLRSGFRLDVVDSAAAALAAAEAEVYDLILLDLDLAAPGGIETTARIRALGGRSANIPILGLSHQAGIDPAIEKAARDAGVTCVVARPTEHGGFIESVQTALEVAAPVRRLGIG